MILLVVGNFPELSSYVGRNGSVCVLEGVQFPFSPETLKTTWYSHLSNTLFTSLTYRFAASLILCIYTNIVWRVSTVLPTLIHRGECCQLDGHGLRSGSAENAAACCTLELVVK